MQHYYLDANAHVGLNLTNKQFAEIENEDGIHGNPYSPNFMGRKAAELIERAKEKIAELLGAEDSSNIIFTNSCTESNYWACLMLSNYCMVNEYYQGEEHDLPKINVSPYEHRSINDCLVLLPFDKDYIVLDKAGNINSMNRNDHSIFIGVQNEIGTIADFNEIRKQTKLIMLSDLAQAIGKIPINLRNMGVDIATFGAHKFGGPSGVGIIYLKDPNMWCPINNCKSYGMNVPGSMNILGIWQTSIAMENCLKNMRDNIDRAFGFRNKLEATLIDLGFDIIGQNGNRTPTTTLAKVPDGMGVELLLDLEEYGIFVGLGSACGSREKQELKSAAALDYNCMNTECIRISQDGRYGEEDANFICEKISNIIKYWRKDERHN